ncbi:MAG: DNA-binding SARP family transcriptional activator, partial [Myxococcota bacterium]
QVLHSVLSQPKRLNLLAYLVLTATDGFTRREKLLALFWPDSEADKARASLRRSLSYLRKSLGEGVLVTRGDDEVGIAAGAVDCDVARFEEALSRGDLESACDLHAGPLLDGLFLSDTPALSRWLEDERSRLEQRAVDAVASLADGEEAKGDVPAALAWARKALALRPFSQTALRRVIGLLGRSGDREGAIRAYDTFAARLAEELDELPSVQTKTLMEDIRSAPAEPARPVIPPSSAASPAPVPAPTAPGPPATPAATPTATPLRRYPRVIAASTLALAASIIAAVLWGSLDPEPTDPILRYTLAFAEGEEISGRAGRRFALSPDGTHFVYSSGPEGPLRIRQRDELNAFELPGTNRGRAPFFSPDGKRIGFFADGQLKLVALDGGPIVVISDQLDTQGGVAWGSDGLLYAQGSGFGGLVRLPPEPGAIPQAFTQLNASVGESNHVWPEALPDGAGILFTALRAGLGRNHAGVAGSGPSIAVADLQTGEHHAVVEGIFARYAKSQHLLYVTPDSTLMVAPFDLATLEVSGPPTVVSPRQRVGFRGSVDLAVSETGTLVYATGPGWGTRELVWVDRAGAALPLDPSWQGGFAFPTLSPDGSRLAVTLSSPDGVDIWIQQLESGARAKLTVEGGVSGYPAWTPDGRSVTYFSDAAGPVQLWTKPADGSAPASLQLSRPRELAESLWTPDGEWLIYRTSNVPAVPGSGGAGASDILAIRPGVDEEPIPLAVSDFAELGPALSPDGRWLAYASEETGRGEVFVIPFPNSDAARWSVSPDGGTEPQWSHSGREIFYRSLRDELVAVEVQTTPTFA